MKSGSRPKRISEVIEQPVDEEIVVYGLENDDVHLLNATTAAVWRRCDGASTVDEIAADLGAPFNADVVWAALTELDRAGLLVEHVDVTRGLSRRQLMKRMAIAAVALPVVTSIVAPTAAAAASTCGQLGDVCSANAPCCPNQNIDCFGDPQGGPNICGLIT